VDRSAAFGSTRSIPLFLGGRALRWPLGGPIFSFTCGAGVAAAPIC